MGLLRQAGQLAARHQLEGRRTLGWQQAAASVSFHSPRSFQRPVQEGDEYVFVDWLLNELQRYLFLLKHEKEPKYLSIWTDVSRDIPGSPDKEQDVCWY